MTITDIILSCVSGEEAYKVLNDYENIFTTNFNWYHYCTHLSNKSYNNLINTNHNTEQTVLEKLRGGYYNGTNKERRK